MGQFIQDGSRIMYETVLNVEKSREEVMIGEEPVDLDGLNYWQDRRWTSSTRVP